MEDITEGLVLNTNLQDAIKEYLTHGAEEERREALLIGFQKLNENGQKKAVQYTEDLTQIPAYQREKEEDNGTV